VGEEIDRLVDFEGHDPERILVATFSTQVRDRLREEFAYVPWEQGQPTTIICENVHRVKGLEFDYVVLVATADDAASRVSDALLYVGVSRAIFGLTVIGPRSIADRLGIE
jgi:DNA helicase IV